MTFPHGKVACHLLGGLRAFIYLASPSSIKSRYDMGSCKTLDFVWLNRLLVLHGSISYEPHGPESNYTKVHVSNALNPDMNDSCHTWVEYGSTNAAESMAALLCKRHPTDRLLEPIVIDNYYARFISQKSALFLPLCVYVYHPRQLKSWSNPSVHLRISHPPRRPLHSSAG